MVIRLKILERHEVVITEQVFYELKLSKQDALKNFEHEKIQVVTADSSIAEKYGLHIGEALVISYAREESDLAVIDDKKVRSVAEKEKIKFVGTATLLRAVIDKKLINRAEAEQLIDKIAVIGNCS